MLNKVFLIGRLGRDPESFDIHNGNEKLCRFTLATNEVWTDRNGNRQEKTEWHNLVFFGRLAEICQHYLKKGDLIYCSGKITTNQYTARDGSERLSFEIVCSEMKMLGGRTDKKTIPPEGIPSFSAKNEDYDMEEPPF